MKRGQIPSREELEALTASGMNIKEVAAHYGKCIKTISTWREKRGISVRAPLHQKSLDYKRMDRLIQDGKSQGEIADIMSCSHQTVSNRMSEINGSRILNKSGKYEESYAPLIPPQERLARALEIKMEGWTWEHKAAFYRSSEGARWAAQIQGEL